MEPNETATAEGTESEAVAEPGKHIDESMRQGPPKRNVQPPPDPPEGKQADINELRLASEDRQAKASELVEATVGVIQELLDDLPDDPILRRRVIERLNVTRPAAQPAEVVDAE